MTQLDNFKSFYETLSTASLEKLGDVYTDDLGFVDPVTRHSGLAALRSYFEKLLKNCTGCRFEIDSATVSGATGYINWVMTFSHPRLKRGKPISVDGFSVLRFRGNLIEHQRDYYDMGAMIYEHVPLVGGVVAGLRRRMAA